MLTKISEHDADIHSIKKAIYGNGLPGMDEQLRNIWTWIEAQKKAQDKRAEFWGKFSWLIITIIVTGFFGFIAQFAYFWFTIVPELQKVK